MDETKYRQLETELTIDPKAVGYAGMTDEQAADALNEEGRTGEKKDVTLMATWRLLTAVDDAEYAALTPIQSSMFHAVLACVQVDLSNPRIRAILQRIFVATLVTKANMVALAREPAARWEILDLGGEVAYWDVNRARQL
ncbi:MAG: hypothetical protein A2Y38_25080 [Spirochaetes bacterium GWB1_59_5]|nr:MAG: hypothetical protein A2Y38_25080 [Spirochaetes bacterium GWB1_59_5]